MRDSQRLATVKTDESHLSEEEKTKYAQAARGFESIFVSMLF
jgi:Rod binding domain-containing protein